MKRDDLNLWQVTSSRAWGGRESVPLAIHRQLQKIGIGSMVFCAERSQIEKRFTADPDVVALPFRRKIDFKTRKQLAGRFTRNPPNAVICHFSRDLPILRLALGRTSQTRLALVKHLGPGKAKKDLLHRWIYRRVDRVFGVSDYISRRCRETYPLPPEKIQTWHPGIDVKRFALNPAARERVRSQLQLDEQTILICYVARLTPGKGHRDLIAAFGQLAAGRENVRLALVGSAGPGEEWFVDELHALVAGPIAEKVIWPGFVEDIPAWLWAGDIFVSPSPCEAFGLNTVEALAAGLPVIGTTGGGTPDIITHEDNGLLVSPHSPIELTQTLKSLCDNPIRRRSLGERARSSVVQRFALEQTTAKLVELIC